MLDVKKNIKDLENFKKILSKSILLLPGRAI